MRQTTNCSFWRTFEKDVQLNKQNNSEAVSNFAFFYDFYKHTIQDRGGACDIHTPPKYRVPLRIFYSMNEMKVYHTVKMFLEVFFLI